MSANKKEPKGEELAELRTQILTLRQEKGQLTREATFAQNAIEGLAKRVTGASNGSERSYLPKAIDGQLNVGDSNWLQVDFERYLKGAVQYGPAVLLLNRTVDLLEKAEKKMAEFGLYMK